MKNKITLSFARAFGLLLSPALCVVAAVAAEPLKETTAVHARPDRASPAITFLKAGSQPTPAAAELASVPAGWMAVELPGPFEGYVRKEDLSKSLDLKPGSPIRVAPQPDAGVLATAEKGDKMVITGLRGRFAQISLEKKLVGYIPVGAHPPAATPAPLPAAPAQPGPMAPAPVSPGVYGAATAGQPAPSLSLGDSNTLPRQFAGRLVSTRRPFTPRRPYDYALNDDAGKRYAYLDLSKLLLTEQIDKFVDRAVVVFGPAKAVPDTRDIVIQVETLRLK